MSSNSKYVSKARQKIKEDLVYIHGGKCIMCGYNKCMAALQFHHIKPEEKKIWIVQWTKSVLGRNFKRK